MILKNLLRQHSSNKQMQQAKMLDGYSPIFSQFGQNVYASDVVQMCIDIIATEISKLKPKHIRTDPDGMQATVNGSFNRLFKFAPNELMTTRDFLEKVIWVLFLNYNAFIYPMYEIKKDDKGIRRKEYTGFYPLNPTGVTFFEDTTGALFIEMQFSSGEKFILRYSDVIHLRKRFSKNEIMGGGIDGQPDNDSLLKVIQINDSLLQGLEKGVKSSLSIRGIIKYNSLLDDEKQQAEREKFEASIKSAESGVLPMDMKSEYKDIKPDPKLVDKDTLEFLDKKILYNYGISMPILSGDFNDEQYQSFYEKSLEPIVIGLSQAFSKTLFTIRQQDHGNEIVFFQKDMMYLSTQAKLDLLKTAGEQGLLTDNQKLAILGYPPIPDGDKRTVSLNYIDVSLVNSYQMGKSKNTQGGQGNE
ncbi:phage portal protein [Oceanobacillus damuensis]|uniref:phage portal protein n=1 Tax=Oceanobacillus damuensis TaxID=937928 RepID=UPI00082C253F|nr:phage portal protein [Oceanobacillus damuensis]